MFGCFCISEKKSTVMTVESYLNSTKKNFPKVALSGNAVFSLKCLIVLMKAFHFLLLY